jgi:hypothetical protein
MINKDRIAEKIVALLDGIVEADFALAVWSVMYYSTISKERFEAAALGRLSLELENYYNYHRKNHVPNSRKSH